MSEEPSPTVRDRIDEEIDGRIHGIAVTASRGSTTYAVVSHSTSGRGGDRVALTTVVVDLGDDTVKASGNSLWVPRDPNTVEGLTRIVARTRTDVTNDRGDEPAVQSIPGVDAEDLLATEVEPDEYDGGLSKAEGDAPVPSGADIMAERLREAGVDTEERFNRLKYDRKSPWSHDLGDRDYIVGNYGVYATRDDPLVLVDVDYPERLDTPLPDTLTVSSPHGDDERAHRFFTVDDPERYREALGKWNAGPEWGEIRVANEYVVGPGSKLEAVGCTAGDHKDGEDGGCDVCSDPSRGFYEIVEDTEIAEVSAEWLIDLAGGVDEDTEDVREAAATDGGSGDETPEDADVPDDVDEAAHTGEPDEVECHRCGDEIPETEAVVLASDGDTTVWGCRGGCE